MPKKPHKSKKPLYRRPPPRRPGSSLVAPKHSSEGGSSPLAGLLLAEDATSTDNGPLTTDKSQLATDHGQKPSPRHGEATAGQPLAAPKLPSDGGSTLNLLYSSPGIWLYHNNCLAVLDAIAARYPEGRFDCIFADPPYFLSNGGITCHAGRMVSVHKGDWDQSRGPEWNHEFNTAWLQRCQRVLKPNGTLWVTGTHHVIFSVGFALQQLGYKILNDIAWEKPNPPPNLSCRYFTHSTETILWAAKNDKSKHLFNYQAMKAVTGKQMKTVWRSTEFETRINANERELEKAAAESESEIGGNSRQFASKELSPVWTMPSPSKGEKSHGKHPTQKPVALVERCLLAATNPGDLVLDPFMGGGTTAVACIRLNRQFVGVELDEMHISFAMRRSDRETVLVWLRHYRVRVSFTIHGRDAFHRVPNISENDLDLFPNLIDRSAPMADKPEPQTERIFHETKFVFLSCAHVSSASVVHTTVDVSLQEAWSNAPNGKKRETTHVVRCETEILRLKSD